MIYDLNLRVSPRVAATQTLLKNEIEKATGVKIDNWRICSRSIDARQRQVFVNLRVEASKGEPLPPLYTPVNLPKLPSDAPKVIIVGAGPGGLFAALRAIETGIKPILLERGRDVDSRRKILPIFLDLALLTQIQITVSAKVAQEPIPTASSTQGAKNVGM